LTGSKEREKFAMNFRQGSETTAHTRIPGRDPNIRLESARLQELHPFYCRGNGTRMRIVILCREISRQAMGSLKIP
jgi:hypothetical protein